ncbi:MAG: FixH family protein [Bacteroidetes bacterium]|nr:FixH family protein [Bacteroidota bacterium]
MKISWGYRVMFLYIGFAGLIIYFVTRSINEKVDLVTPDYYAQELKFQDKIESINRNNELSSRH